MFQTGRSVQLSNTPALRPFTKTCMTIPRARFKIPARVKTDPILNNYLPQTMEDSARSVLKAETHDATNRGDTSPCLHCCCDRSLALSLSLQYVARN